MNCFCRPITCRATTVTNRHYLRRRVISSLDCYKVQFLCTGLNTICRQLHNKRNIYHCQNGTQCKDEAIMVFSITEVCSSDCYKDFSTGSSTEMAVCRVCAEPIRVVCNAY